MLVRWPGKIAPGTVNGAMTINVDVAPSILEMAGVPVPSSMQGRSFVAPSESRDAFYYEFHEYPDYDHCARKHRGIRTPRWKLIEYWEKPVELELYDMEADPDEMRNVAKSRPQVVRELEERMEALRRQLGASDAPGPVPSVGPCVPGRP